MISLVHLVLAAVAWVLLWRGLERQTFVGHAPDPQIAAAFALAALVASAAGSVALVAAGRRKWSPERALLIDLASLVATAWVLAVIEFGPWTRDLGGVAVVLIVVLRLLPGALAIVKGAPAWLALVVAFGAYGALASWLPVASLPFGDQIGYLLMADRLAHGSIDAALDPGLFVRILGVPPSASDTATHVAATALGPRPIQGYAMPLLLLPGWVAAGRLGAGMVMAIVGAWTSYQMLLILRDLFGTETEPVGGWTWLMASAFLPTSLLAIHLYPNIVGAAIVATAFRLGFTAPERRPALAAAVLALTLFLNPRDVVALVVLGVFLVWGPAATLSGSSLAPSRGWRLGSEAHRVVAAVLAVALVAVVSNAVLYGVPLPYAGYLFGTEQAQQVTRQPSIVATFWVGLPAILFDRTLGLAGNAPWLFTGLLGLAPALRRDRSRILPAALTVGLGLAGLSFYRLWEGGYAPPGRYFVDTLPLWIPFVAYGLAIAGDFARSARGRLTGEDPDLTPRTRAGTATPAETRAGMARAVGTTIVVALLVFMSGVTAFVLDAVPSLALNSAFDDKIRYAVGHILGIDPLGWLPSFQPLTPTWYVTAYLALIPALAVCAFLVWAGVRYDLAAPESSAAMQLASSDA